MDRPQSGERLLDCEHCILIMVCQDLFFLCRFSLSQNPFFETIVELVSYFAIKKH